MSFAQKLPRRVVPAGRHGIFWPNNHCLSSHTEVSSTYTINTTVDWRLCVNKWNAFMEKEKQFVIGHKLLMLLYLGDKGVFQIGRAHV